MFINILVENPDITYDKETLLSSLAGCVRAQNVCAVLIMIFTILPICKILPFTNAGPAHLRLLGLENSRIMSLHESLSAVANQPNSPANSTSQKDTLLQMNRHINVSVCDPFSCRLFINCALLSEALHV